MKLNRFPAVALLACVSALAAGCNGISGSSESSSDGSSNGSGTLGSSSGMTGDGGTTVAPTYTLGGTVTGLGASGETLVVQDGLGSTLTFITNGRFVFPGALTPGETYLVSVQTQPGTPPQFCRVANATGVISDTDVTNVAISCVTIGKYLFTVSPYDNNGSGSLAAFSINPNTGALTASSGSPYTPTEMQPYDIAVDPSGQYIYVANSASATISTDSVGTGGALMLDTSTASTGTSSNLPFTLVINPTGPYLFVGSDDNPNGTIESYSLNGGVLTPASGTLAASVYPAGNDPFGLALDFSSALLLGANFYDGDLISYTLSAAGVLTPTAGSPNPFQQSIPTNTPRSVALYPGARYLYVTDPTANSVSFYTYDATGVPTLSAVYTSASGIGLSPHGLTVDASGSFLYVANSGSGTVSAFTINPTNGVLTPVVGSPFTASGTASSMTPTSVRVDPSSQFAYVTNGDAGTISVFSINFANGVLTPVGNPVSAVVSTGGGPSALAIE